MSCSKTMGMRRVVVTGVGMVTSMGLDVPTVWQRLLAGESGITNLDCFTPENLERYHIPEDFPTIGGGIKHFDLKEILHARKKDVTKEDLKQIKYTDRFTQFALAASLEAINDSGVNLETEDPERAGVIIASGMGGVSLLGGRGGQAAQRGGAPGLSLPGAQNDPQSGGGQRLHQFQGQGAQYRPVHRLRRRGPRHRHGLPLHCPGGGGHDGRRRQRSRGHHPHPRRLLPHGRPGGGLQRQSRRPPAGPSTSTVAALSCRKVPASWPWRKWTTPWPGAPRSTARSLASA